MKLLGIKKTARRLNVAPFTGAWIETSSEPPVGDMTPVAPFTGAWIETLKLDLSNHELDVAPFTGAWIETIYQLTVRN